jgi:hypothetical protein
MMESDGTMSGWDMSSMGLFWILIPVALVLAIIALIKYLLQ